LIAWSAPARNPLHALVYSHFSTRLTSEVIKNLASFLHEDAEVFFVSATRDDMFSLMLHGQRVRFRCFVVPTTNVAMRAAVANSLYFNDILSSAAKTQRFQQDLVGIGRYFGNNVQCKIAQNSLVLNLQHSAIM
jgi:hypothetical protein